MISDVMRYTSIYIINNIILGSVQTWSIPYTPKLQNCNFWCGLGVASVPTNPCSDNLPARYFQKIGGALNPWIEKLIVLICCIVLWLWHFGGYLFFRKRGLDKQKRGLYGRAWKWRIPQNSHLNGEINDQLTHHVFSNVPSGKHTNSYWKWPLK
jgi:hypothetical protein